MERSSCTYLHDVVSARRAGKEREELLVLECSGVGCSVAWITRRGHVMQGVVLTRMAGTAYLGTSASRSFAWHWRRLVIYCCLVVAVVHLSAAWQQPAH